VSARCDFILGPCVDGTQAGRRCSDTAGPAGRCTRHATTKVCPVCGVAGIGDPASCDHAGAISCSHCGIIAPEAGVADRGEHGWLCDDCNARSEYQR
jgi:predicted RNA-binding Zn-ribbon protein involved in translation (DUF1610 family)